MQLRCPWCGPREEIEFRCGGQAHVAYPDAPLETDDVTWGEFLFIRENPKGLFAERWVHSSGCRRWFHVVRDTVTNTIHAVYRLDQPRPVIA